MTVRGGLLASLSLLAVLAPAVAHADAPSFTTVKLKDAADRTEPRIAVARDDVRWAVSNTAGGAEIVYTSRDGGRSWQKTAGDPPQTKATIDTDIVTMPTGRVLSSELDEGGLNFPSGYTDDQGATWTASRGSNTLADQDRQWFAVGPADKTTGQPTVYLLYHNLGSGTAQHNMFVAKSVDGGATFGPPVPSAQPGTDAYADLQCSDSGGPSSISVNQRTGRVYVFYTTRAGIPADGAPDAGGCGASVFGPLEFNVVNATRVWVSTSADGSLGSWTSSLAVDDAKTNQVVSMQLAYGALDNQGGVYVAYPEAPQAYPKLDGAAVKLVWQKPAADGRLTGTWSPPVTLVPPGGPGSDLVHLVVGDPGKVAVAYYRGEPNPAAGKDPLFFLHALQSMDVTAATPTVTDVKVSDVPAYQWTVTGMMGVCDPGSPAGGVEAGLTCSRSADVWGVALDASCRLSIAWPTSGASKGSTRGVANADPGTFVSTQTGGPGLCADPRSLPGGSLSAAFQPLPAAPGRPGSGTAGTRCRDRVRPRSRPRGAARVAHGTLRLSGTAVDLGCGTKGRAARDRVRSVSVAVGRRLADRRCRFLRGDGRFGPEVSCLRTTYVAARGAAHWSIALKARLPRGRYVVWTRATDVVGNVERKAAKRNLRRLTVHG
jgi:BNR repeat-like domain